MLGEGAFLHEEVRLEAGTEAVVHSGSVLVRVQELGSGEGHTG